MRYRTEIHVATDRYVCLQLPSFFPEGTAVVTVTVRDDGPPGPPPRPTDEADRQDVEWWEDPDAEEVDRRR